LQNVQYGLDDASRRWQMAYAAMVVLHFENSLEAYGRAMTSRDYREAGRHANEAWKAQILLNDMRHRRPR
jgi:hypothetical protein